jgi:hypothetical protein
MDLEEADDAGGDDVRIEIVTAERKTTGEPAHAS